MKIKQIQAVKAMAQNKDKEINLKISQGFITNGEWLIKEDYLNTSKFFLNESNFWESKNKELTKHSKKHVVEVNFDNIEYNLKTPKGLNVIKVALKDPHNKSFNCYIQQIYFEKFIQPLIKNEYIKVETSCPEYPTQPDPFDPHPYANNIIFRYKNEFIGVLMPVCVLDEDIRYDN